MHPQAMPRRIVAQSWKGAGVRQDIHEQEVASLGWEFRKSTALVCQQLAQEPGWCPHAAGHCRYTV